MSETISVFCRAAIWSPLLMASLVRYEDSESGDSEADAVEVNPTESSFFIIVLVWPTFACSLDVFKAKREPFDDIVGCGLLVG